MSPTALTAALVVVFAAWVTLHVTVAWTLAHRRQGWRALSALLVPPVAPWIALREGMPVRGAAWIFLALAYGVALVLARR